MKQASSSVDEARWAAVLRRDAAAEGSFVYAVETTGVYCRPGCPSRRPRREHVRFFPGVVEAARAGFRACLRCKPDAGSGNAQQAEIIARVCRCIEQAEQVPPLRELAEIAGWSAFHLQRRFKAVVGVSPRQYASALRHQRMRERLAEGCTVTEALYAAGFGSSGRFYEASDRALGMKPKALQKGGEAMRIEFAVGESTLGSVLVARSERGVCAILLGEDPAELVRDLERRFSAAELVAGDAAFEGLVARVVELVEAPAVAVDLPLDVRGTAFQQRVWEALRRIPAGSTATYTELAEMLHLPKSMRAVAQACAANPLAVVVPCHRVVRSDGGLAGYRWGVERKRALLAREGKQPGPETSLPLF